MAMLFSNRSRSLHSPSPGYPPHTSAPFTYSKYAPASSATLLEERIQNSVGRFVSKTFFSLNLNYTEELKNSQPNYSLTPMSVDKDVNWKICGPFCRQKFCDERLSLCGRIPLDLGPTDLTRHVFPQPAGPRSRTPRVSSIPNFRCTS